MKLVLASRNKHKIEEWQATLGKYVDGVEILSLDEVGIFGEIEENGATFEENAFIKARAAAKSGYFFYRELVGTYVGNMGRNHYARVAPQGFFQACERFFLAAESVENAEACHAAAVKLIYRAQNAVVL